MKVKFSALIVAALFSTAFLGACSTAPEHDAAAQAQSAIKLEARNWDSFSRLLNFTPTPSAIWR